VAKQSGLKFKMIDETTHSTILINGTKLQRIIDNNLTNAIKYTHENETININLSCNNEKIIFEISTHSTIIENPEHIFDAYYRENDDRDGLGLGLNLVKRICDQENVNITLTSTQDITTFIYYFPKDIK